MEKGNPVYVDVGNPRRRYPGIIEAVNNDYVRVSVFVNRGESRTVDVHRDEVTLQVAGKHPAENWHSAAHRRRLARRAING